MQLTDKISPAPGEVRFAGALTAVPGFAGVVLAIIVLIDSIAEPASHGSSYVFAEVGYYLLLGAGTLVCAIGLLIGKTWARSPAVVIALLLVGIGWYTTGPSGQPAFGIPIMVLGVLVLVLLFRAPSRAWVLGMREGETEQEAADRDSAQGRAARRADDEDAG